MKKVTKFHKQIAISYLKTAALVMIVSFFLLPCYIKVVQDGNTIFTLYLNGKQVGCVSDINKLDEYLLQARTKLAKESDGMLFVDTDLEVVGEDKYFGRTDSKSYIVDQMYQVLSESRKETRKRSYTVKINEFTVNLTGKRKDLKSFSKQAGSRNRINLLLSGVEGIGMGLVGSGLPDIPLFTGVLLKSIYEIAISFGYEYESVRERIFILKIIQGALESGEALTETDMILDEMIRGGDARTDLDSQMTRTAEKLSEELLYMKFLQGIPVAGVVGGISDTVYLKKITEYAHLKYYKRFVSEHIHV